MQKILFKSPRPNPEGEGTKNAVFHAAGLSWQTPRIDNRSAEDIVSLVKSQTGLNYGSSDPLGEAIVQIFARYCELIIERLNQVPEKNYRAFLNELGVSRNPPIAAQVPLTFTPVKSSANRSIVIPKYTKVAAPAGEGESSPVVFETTQTLTLTMAELYKVVTLDTKEDRYTDHDLSATGEILGTSPFKGIMPIKHEFYIGVEASLAVGKMSSLHLSFSIEEQLPRSKEYILEWRIRIDQGWQLLSPIKDTTLALSHSGEIVFNDLPKWGACTISGKQYYFLSCRLVTRSQSPDSEMRSKPSLKLPVIRNLEIACVSTIEDAKIDNAFFNNLPLDLSKDFFPLGARPDFGDVLYLSCSAFSQSEADVTVKIKLTNPASAGRESPIPTVNQSGRAVTQWEYWNGERWDILACCDETQALTEDGNVSFRIPQAVRRTRINGVEAGWVRVRLISGHYGQEGNFAYPEAAGQGFKYLASTLAPPAIASISVNSSRKTRPVRPEALITHNDLVFKYIDIANNRSFAPFRTGHDPFTALYFGFRVTDRKTIAGSWLDVYIRVSHIADRLVYRGDQQFPLLKWQYWNGEIWQVCKVRDEAQSLNVTGVISLFIAEDIVSWDETSLCGEFCEERQNEASFYWVRAVWVAGDYQCEPVLQRILLNTTPAIQTLTLENEILGSGNGTPNQIFYAARTPILDKVILEVKEPQLPAEAELARILEEEGEEAVNNIKRGQKEDEIWVRWHEVNDFLESGHSDRHFVIERLSGEIRFGDGIKGMVPFSGANNIRLHVYKTGGGTSGNKPPNSITQLRTSLPLVASVVNLEAAAGGLDIEDWNSVYARGSSYLRHRGRAISAVDYEDLARNASPLVARAKCFPLKDLSDSVSADKPGFVSLVVVPKKPEPEPKPSLDCLRYIWKFIEPIREPNTNLIVLGPEYIRIHVQAVVAPVDEYTEADIATDCLIRLEAFLHPLTGGEHAKGWAFGERPHRSDIFALLESVPGLEFVQSLQILYQEERPGLLENGNFLVCSGQHRITLSE